MIALSSVSPGTSGMVASLATNDPAMLNRLLAMGISPGVNLHLEKRFPSYVIRSGRSRAALDEAIADVIYIQP
ncbi:FeoA family protein [Okeania sp. SIO2G5]|uniref:FeoA family protein n=1 Tax=Okeania sp. SIO2G5 TaxID=2607796 RepID=UPI0013C0A10A|nr:FeoA family protein [Okeania sp. SIO2G5]NEP76461.1 ferrous iron transport protein A [Okeania sp. SIO2G5]